MSNRRRCDPCQKDIDKTNWSKHLKTKFHLKNSQSNEVVQQETQQETEKEHKMKHTQKFKVIPEKVYEQLVETNETASRPKPPIDPEVSHLARTKQRLEDIMNDPKLSDSEKVKMFQQNQEFMRRYEAMVRPNTGNKKTSTAESKMLHLQEQMFAELRRLRSLTTLPAPPAKRRKVHVVEQEDSDEFSDADPVYGHEKKSSAKYSPVETRSGPLKGSVWTEMTQSPSVTKNRKRSVAGTSKKKQTTAIAKQSKKSAVKDVLAKSGDGIEFKPIKLLGNWTTCIR